MKFQVLDIIPHLKNPVTGEIVSTADRLNQVVRTAQRAEELGYDSFSVGERHAGKFISSSPTTVLAAIAAVTGTIRLQSGVTVLSVLDPVRVERFAFEVVPAVRAAAPTTLWGGGDPYGGRPQAGLAGRTGATEPGAAAHERNHTNHRSTHAYAR
jgi:hypothetical protein